MVGGRPDIMKLIKETYVSWGAEVVFITSNYQGNQEMMQGCKEAGIPAFVRRFPSFPKSFLIFCMTGNAVGFLKSLRASRVRVPTSQRCSYSMEKHSTTAPCRTSSPKEQRFWRDDPAQRHSAPLVCP